MDDIFHSRYVKESVALFLNETLISYSLSHQKVNKGSVLGEPAFQPFSIVKHVLNVVLPMAKAFPLKNCDQLLAETLSGSLDPDSPLPTHFELFYNTKQFQVELVSLWLLVAILYQRQRNKFEISSKDRITQEKTENRVKQSITEFEEEQKESLVSLVNDVVKEFESREVGCYVREVLKDVGVNLNRNCSLVVKEKGVVVKSVLVKESRVVAEPPTHNQKNSPNTLNKAQTNKEKQFSFGIRNKARETEKNDKTKRHTLDRKDFFFKNFIFDKKMSPLIEKKLNRKIKKTSKRKSLGDLPKDFAMKRNKRVIKRSFSEHYTVKRNEKSNNGVINLRQCNEEHLKDLYPVEFANKNSESTKNSNDEAIFEEFYNYGDPSTELKFSDMFPGKEKLFK